MRFAITGTDARFLPLRKLLLADGHEITDPASADMVISPPWDPSARYARREEYQIAIARLTAEGAIALLRPETGLSGAHILLLGYGRIARLLARELQKAGALVTAAAHERGLRYIRAPGLPAKYAPDRAAVILRDAVYAAAAEPLPRLGLAVTGSHCTFSRALEAFRPLKRDYALVPILSGAAAGTDTRFFAASAFRAELEAFCGREAVDTIVKAEPLGTAQRLDALLVAPCTGNTLAKLARGVTDTAVTMACKAHLRNGAPLILAISTNDGLSGSAESIAALLQRKNVYFVPFRQDAPHQKPFSLQSDFDLLGETIKAAMEGRQLQPVLL